MSASRLTKAERERLVKVPPKDRGWIERQILAKKARPPETRAVLLARHARMERGLPPVPRGVPRSRVVPGRAYVIHARNGRVGVAIVVDGRLGYALRREKFARVYLFVEFDWSEGEPFGTAVPLRALRARPPLTTAALRRWLCRAVVSARTRMSEQPTALLEWLAHQEKKSMADAQAKSWTSRRSNVRKS